MGLLQSIFGTYSQREVKKLERIAAKIEALADTYRAMTNEELRGVTDTLRARLAHGETTDDILPDAFAAVREADDRILGKRPFHVQLLGGIVLHQGRIAEMKTGEGKTLVATLPAYLNALTGKGVHIVTVNEYLAKCGWEEMGRVYGFLGLTTGLITQSMTTSERQAAYQADITYGTNSEFGFDYLRDHMKHRREDLAQRPLHFAIVDEVDSILIDEARTPLIISGARGESADTYKKADAFVRSLKKYVLDEAEKDYQEQTQDANIPAEYTAEKRMELAELFGTMAIAPAPTKEKPVDETAYDLVHGADGKAGHLTRRGREKVEKRFETDLHDPALKNEIIRLVRYAEEAYTRWDLGRDYRIQRDEVVPVSYAFHNALKNEGGDVEVLYALGAKHGIRLEFDYMVDEKNRVATLTSAGIRKAEAYFGISFGSEDGEGAVGEDSEELAELLPYIKQALQAHGVMERDRDYVVQGGKVLIVDHYTGRIMPGRRFNHGLHQALEAKENVAIQGENLTVATITYQNFFRLYEKLSGMTGTALTEEEEFRDIYCLDVVEIPTNRPMIRVDHPDIVYCTQESKYKRVVEIVKECQAKEQPVLIGTASVEKSELLDKYLRKNGIKAEVLNAKNHEREAHIIAQAGTPGAVTISTNMAGRGTDILLGGNPEYLAKDALKREGVSDELIAVCDSVLPTEDPEVLKVRADYAEKRKKYAEEIAPAAEKVRQAGGLFILGTERHESRRIDNQLRGRSGRQGDPGESLFIVSLEDDLLRLFGGETAAQRFSRLTGNQDYPLQFKMLSGFIRNAQKSVESRHFQARKTVLEYDDVMNQQREVIYGERQEVLTSDDPVSIAERMVRDYLSEQVAAWDGGKNPRAVTEELPFLLKDKNEIEGMREDELLSLLLDRAGELKKITLETVESTLNIPGKEFVRSAVLSAIDRNWMKHLEDMDDIKESVGLNSYAQRKPIVEYRLIGGEAFDEMVAKLKREIVRIVLTARPEKKAPVAKKRPVPVPQPKGNTPAAPRRVTKTGPNDPCPCGSGKKYKYCCGVK